MNRQMNYQRIWWIGLGLSVWLPCSVDAQITVTSPTLNLPVPDGDFVGIRDSLTVPPSVADPLVSSITVILNVSGEFVGDLYVQLTHTGQQAVLLNRVGRTGVDPFGYDDTSLHIRFNDDAPSADIHTYRATLAANVTASLTDRSLTGDWVPDGRNVDPQTVLDTSLRTAFLTSFRDTDPAGTWTLFLADIDSGSQQTLVSWGLEINLPVIFIPEASSLTPLVAVVLTLAFGAMYKFSASSGPIKSVRKAIPPSASTDRGD